MYEVNLVFVSPECSSERDYVITDSLRSMYVCVCMQARWNEFSIGAASQG